MSEFVERQGHEEGDNRKWEESVRNLQDFLSRECKTIEIEGEQVAELPVDGARSRAAQEANEAIAIGDFEPAALYIDQEIERARKDIETAMVQSAIAPLQVRLATLEKLKDSLERQ